MQKKFLGTLLVLALAFTLMFVGCTLNPGEPTEPVDIYSVTIKESGNGTITADKAEVEAGDTVVITFTPNEGCALSRVRVNGDNYTNDVVDGVLTLTDVQEDLEISAVFVVTEMTVTFNTDGGDSIAPVDVRYGTAVTKPEDPEKFGFIFEGWTLDGVAYDFSSPVKGNITLVATWSRDPVAKYSVKHYIAASGTATNKDILYATEILSSEYGKVTEAVALSIPGYTAEAFEQITIVEDAENVVNVFYTRDMMVESYEWLPFDGEYSYDIQGWDNSGKILLLEGDKVGLSVGYNAVSIELSSDAHSGNKSILFVKGGADTHTSIYIELNETQLAALRNGANMSFWYKALGTASGKIANEEIVGELATEWTKVVLNRDQLTYTANNGWLRFEPTGTWDQVSVWIDDIVIGAPEDAPPAPVIPEVTLNGLVMDFEGLTSNRLTVKLSGTTGKMMLVDGTKFFDIGYNAEAIEISSDAHGGSGALRLQKGNSDTHTSHYILLTEDQIAALKAGASMSFWYKADVATTAKINDVRVDVMPTEWTKVELTADQAAYSGTHGFLRIEPEGTWEKVSVWVDDIVVVPAAAEEKPADPEPTNPLALGYEGLTADRLEVVQSGTTGKQLNIDGVKAADIGYNAEAVGIGAEAYSGTGSLWLQKGGSDTHTNFYIMLSEEQVNALKEGATMFFWYKTSAGGVKINDVEVAPAATEWTKVELTEAQATYSATYGFLRLEPYGTWDAVSYYVDDITVVPVA